ncbi:helix-turn-helix domain-containing protein [Paenibacillaceae bacterium]|nr:helix-turn-helix domain-containing protein [Paenibacillaceae bacterium]
MLLYTEHSAVMANSLDYIEKHLKVELTLEAISAHASFSMYHYHRLFHSYVGSALAEYIRKRRLTNAASELITTDRRILEIALDYRFDSQESFTRAFKKMFYMTPGRYRSFTRDLIMNQERDEEMDRINREPHGWVLSGSHPASYEIGVDRTTVHHGRAAGYIGSCSVEAIGFATMMQMFKAEQYRGQRLQLSGFIKTERVEDWCGLWMRVDGKDGEALQFDNMSNRPIRGTADWNQYKVVLDVPRDSEGIAFGILLSGRGRAWLDSLRFDAVNEQVPSTNMEMPTSLPEGPVNLTFEEQSDEFPVA